MDYDEDFENIHVSVEERLSNIENALVHLFGEKQLCFKKLHEEAKLPSKAHQSDACYDLSCVVDDDFEILSDGSGIYELMPGEKKVFRTGLACKIPDGHALYFWDRSGMAAKHGIHMLAGMIDCGYRSELLVCLINLSKEVYRVCSGDRIVQAKLTHVIDATPTWVDELDDTERGESGFGASGR